MDLVTLLGTSDSPAHDIADAMCIALYGKMQLGISKQSAISVEDYMDIGAKKKFHGAQPS